MMMIRQPRSLRSLSTSAQKHRGPLSGYRVVEVGNFIAGPLCGTLLGYYGAEVIKIEPMGGDQIRDFRDADPQGTGWWWRSIGRNKKTICMDLKKPFAQEVVRNLSKDADVFIENFKPGKISEWNLGYEEMKKLNPNLIYSSVSGYGQTGPYSGRAGFASVCEAMGGLRYVNGFPNSPPYDKSNPLVGVSVRPNLSIGDTMAGMNAAFGVVLALLARENGKAKGQLVDTAIYESVFQLMEGAICDYDGAGIIREPSGSTLTGIVPTGTYRTKDGGQIVIGANSDTLFKRLMTAIGKESIGKDEKYDSNAKRVVHQRYIERLIEEFTLAHTTEEVLKVMEKAVIPHGKIYSIKDIAEDEQYNARGMLEEVYVEELGRKLKVPALGTKLSETPGETLWGGTRIGQHTKEVLEGIAGLSREQILKAANDKAVYLPAGY